MSAPCVFEYDKPVNSVEALCQSISNRLVYAVGKDLRSATQRHLGRPALEVAASFT